MAVIATPVVIATPLVIATLLVIATVLVIADSIRNPGSVWHWIPDRACPGLRSGVRDDSLGGRDDNLGGGQPPLFPFGGDMHG